MPVPASASISVTAAEKSPSRPTNWAAARPGGMPRALKPRISGMQLDPEAKQTARLPQFP